MTNYPCTSLLICIITFYFPGMSALAEDYRIDSQKEFDQMQAIVLQPGDAILFKRGERFTGMFSPQGNGVEGKPVRIGVYGAGSRPRINANGLHLAGLFLKDPSFWEVEGLELTNTDGTNDDQGDLFGIYVLADKSERVFEHVYINDCFIHDVNGKVAGKRRGGIHVHIKSLENARFHDLRITNNRITHVGGVGIGNDSSCGKVIISKDGNVQSRNLWTKVYVADNFIDHTGRNGLIARVSKDAVYERNTVANSSRYSTGHSIFNFNTDGIKIQYNEVYGNVGSGGKDRGGFDADYNSVNTYIQYNYSHDNLWFCGIMKRPNHHVIIRHNVSQNDREGIYFYGFEREKKATSIHIYNNTHYVRAGLNVKVFAEDRTPLNSTFENNIFYFEGKGGWGKNAKGINTTFKNNVYFNLAPHASDTQAQTENPRFVGPGKAGKDIDLKTMKALEVYRLMPTSPFLKGAEQIEESGGQNILKQKTSSNESYGAI